MKLEQLNELYLGIYLIADKYNIEHDQYEVDVIDVRYAICNHNGKILLEDGLHAVSGIGGIWPRQIISILRPAVKLEWDRIDSMSPTQAMNGIAYAVKKLLENPRKVPVYDKETRKVHMLDVSNYMRNFKLFSITGNMDTLLVMLSGDVETLKGQT